MGEKEDSEKYQELVETLLKCEMCENMLEDALKAKSSLMEKFTGPLNEDILADFYAFQINIDEAMKNDVLDGLFEKYYKFVTDFAVTVTTPKGAKLPTISGTRALTFIEKVSVFAKNALKVVKKEKKRVRAEMKVLEDEYGFTHTITITREIDKMKKGEDIDQALKDLKEAKKLILSLKRRKNDEKVEATLSELAPLCRPVSFFPDVKNKGTIYGGPALVLSAFSRGDVLVFKNKLNRLFKAVKEDIENLEDIKKKKAQARPKKRPKKVTVDAKQLKQYKTLLRQKKEFSGLKSALGDAINSSRDLLGGPRNPLTEEYVNDVINFKGALADVAVHYLMAERSSEFIDIGVHFLVVQLSLEPGEMLSTKDVDYIDNFVKKLDKYAKGALSFINKKLSGLNTKLKKLEAKIGEDAKELLTGSVDLEGDIERLSDTISKLKKIQTQARIAVNLHKQRKDVSVPLVKISQDTTAISEVPEITNAISLISIPTRFLIRIASEAPLDTHVELPDDIKEEYSQQHPKTADKLAGVEDFLSEFQLFEKEMGRFSEIVKKEITNLKEILDMKQKELKEKKRAIRGSRSGTDVAPAEEEKEEKKLVEPMHPFMKEQLEISVNLLKERRREITYEINVLKVQSARLKERIRELKGLLKQKHRIKSFPEYEEERETLKKILEFQTCKKKQLAQVKENIDKLIRNPPLRF